MTRNVGPLGRIIRLVLGVLILGLFGALDPPWKYLTLVGLLPLGTGILGRCPIHTGRGIDSAARGRPHEP